ncbi:MAG: HAD-IA family hydrolase [Burkholderiales bacterium]|nr:HAD-IA family hydrolase [Burkholderiales bacterium]
MNRRTTLVIFDHEGTLVDFQWRLEEAEAELRAAYAALGYGTSGSYAELWNAAARVAVDPEALARLRIVLTPIYDRWDADALQRWSLRPGAAAVLERLGAAGTRCALVSNCGRQAVSGLLGRFGIEHWLGQTVCREDVRFLKPDPEGIRRVLEAIGTELQQALFVGDSLTDVRAARAAGVRVAIIRGGECDEADFAALPPDHWISRLEEVEALIA